MGTNTTKPFKIQEVNGRGRVGITARNLKDLKREATKRLNIDEKHQPYLDDGTAVLTEEYFKRLPPQTCFTFCLPGDEENNLEMDILKLQVLTNKIAKKLSEGQEAITIQVQELLNGNHSQLVNQALLDCVTSLNSNIDLERREDDSGWFDGLHEKYQNKNSVMKDGAKKRIRNYYQRTKEYLIDHECGGNNTVALLDLFHQELCKNNYYENYFARSAKSNARICDKLGWFKCGGKFNEENCAKLHSINPYGSKEARIVFSTWNLDHIVEKSREILPSLYKAIKETPEDSEVNWRYFYNLLFTKNNLKLVHVACHVKGIHTNKTCDKKKFYIHKKKSKNSRHLVKMDGRRKLRSGR